MASTKVGEIIDDQKEKFQSSILIKEAKAEDYELIAVMGGSYYVMENFSLDNLFFYYLKGIAREV